MNKNQFPRPPDGLSIVSLTFGGGQVGNKLAAVGEAEGIGDVGSHGEVGISQSQFGFETSEEVFFASGPVEDDFDAGDAAFVSPQGLDDEEGACKVGFAA